MSMHTFECGNDSTHVIFDSSSEPIPHIGETVQIWCPNCEQDVTGTYLGQNINQTHTYGETPPTTSIQLYTDHGDDSPYCINCNGECTR